MAFKIEELLPQALRETMPEEAKKIYKDTYNKSWESYDEDQEMGAQDQEAAAHRDAWNAVKQEFVHDEKRSMWYRKGEGPDETGEEEGLLDKAKKLF